MSDRYKELLDAIAEERGYSKGTPEIGRAHV